VISAYLDSVEKALAFDRSLSRSVRHELEDHLREVVAADPEGAGPDAESRAIAKFGDPRIIAAQFAIVSLSKQTTRTAIAITLVIAGIFTMMKVRIAWYEAMLWTTAEPLTMLSGIFVAIDRYSFWLSVVAGIAIWAQFRRRRRLSAELNASYRRHLYRSFLLCLVATTFIIVSIISDGMLTAFRLYSIDLGATALVPIFSMTIEIACAFVLAVLLLRWQQRMAAAMALSQ